MRSIESFRRLVFPGLVFTDTTEIGTAIRPLRRVTLPAGTDVSPSAQRRPPRFRRLAASLLVARAPRRVPRAPIPMALGAAVAGVPLRSPIPPRPATHRTRLPGQALRVPALACVLAGFLLGGPEAAQAQTAQVLVSNSAETHRAGKSDAFLAQSFGTGASTAGWTITNVQLYVHTVTGGTAVSIREDNSGAHRATWWPPSRSRAH